MAVILNIKCESKEDMTKLRNAMYLGLVESPAFVNNEIVMVRNELDEKLTLIIGNNNVDDIEFDLHSNNLLKN